MHTFRFTVRVLALVLAARVGSAYALSLDRMLVTDPTGDVLLSDVVVSTLGTSTGIPPFSTLTLDGPDSQQLRSLMPPLVGLPTVSILDETGAVQSLPSLLVEPRPSPLAPLAVQVQSDVIPEQ
jgi:hypothetical protein